MFYEPVGLHSDASKFKASARYGVLRFKFLDLPGRLNVISVTNIAAATTEAEAHEKYLPAELRNLYRFAQEQLTARVAVVEPRQIEDPLDRVPLLARAKLAVLDHGVDDPLPWSA
jgi:hypothetical protein